jgi:predicted  nucleic acid-binding Zn-ribbon protein
MTLKRCQDCKTDYQDQDAKHFGHCPNCDSTYWGLVSPEEEASSKPRKTRVGEIRTDLANLTKRESDSVNSQFNNDGEIAKNIANQIESNSALISAQNRTTHAVRSLAINFVAAPIISIAIILAVVLASATGNTSLIVITGISGVIVIIATMVASLNELAKSKIY